MTLRLRSDITVSAIRRAAEGAGAFVAILHRGHEEAGMVHVIFRSRMDVGIWSEASAPDGSRGWRCRLRNGAPDDVDALMQKETRFDPDLWLIEIDGPVGPDILPGPLLDA